MLLAIPVTRQMPVGGSWANPQYELKQFAVLVEKPARAATAADDAQHEAKIHKWGPRPKGLNADRN